MLLSTSRTAAAALAVTAVVLLVNLAPARAAGPATVSVRVEGLTETRLTPTTVTTTEASVIKDANPEHACAGTSALGALELATVGNWNGNWFEGLGYFEDTILGETHIFTKGVLSYFWSFWLNDRYSEEAGPCAVQLQTGDRILFFPICDEACPPGPSPTPLEIEAPASANVGEAIPVTVKRYDASGEGSPAAGATITGASAVASADAGGHATVSFIAPGVQLLRASAPESVRTEAPVCVHNGKDGTCGTTLPGAPAAQGGVAGAVFSSAPPYKGPFAVVARVRGVLERHVYPRRRAPRLLAGSASAHVAITSLSLSLRRSYRRHCSVLSNVRGRFVRARCGRDSFFKVSSSPTFSYLLPVPLGPGRYVLDLEATDAAGDHTTIARGTTRTLFFVR